MGTNAKVRRRIVTQLVWIALTVAVFVGAFKGYVWYGTQPVLEQGAFEDASGKTLGKFQIEVRYTCTGRQEGLMFRRAEDFPEDRAMLFVFSRPQVQSFWMKNTIIPLDMLFLDRELRVVGILPNVPPLNLSPRSVEEPSQYVVELNAGVAAKYGITPGARLTLASALPRPEDCAR